MLSAHRIRRLNFWAFLLLICTNLEIDALPATTSVPHTTHIVSYVHQGRVTAKNADLREFDYETIQDNDGKRSSAILSTESPHPISQLYGAFIEQLDMSLNNSFPTTKTKPSTFDETLTETSMNHTDDLLLPHQNTLDDADEIFGHNEQHESSTTGKNDSDPNGGGDSMWNRMKQSIPVLEPVRHLLNTVRDQHNQTVHAAKQFHHALTGAMAGGLGDHMATNESTAIETEEDRETANDSTEFKLLDFVGSIISMIWGFIGNLQRAFAASSGNVLASSSSSSSGGQ